MIKLTSNKDKILKQLDIVKKNTLTKVGLFVESEAKLRCPVDTGLLRNSIDSVVEVPSVIIGTNIDYSIFVEFGTSKQKSQPYLLPAMVENKTKIINYIEKNLKEGMM